MRRLLARGVALVVFGISAACGLVIGLDDRPARPDAGGDGAPDEDARFCAQAKGALLCDDFDDPRQDASDHWFGVPSLKLKSPGVLREAGMAILPNAHATSQPSSLEVTYYNDLDGLTSALLASEFDGGVASRGFVFSFDVQLPDLVNLHPDATKVEDVGPDPALASQPALAIGGFLTITDDFKRYGSLLGLSATDIALTEGIEAEVTDNYARVAHLDLSALGEQGWIRLTQATGPRDHVLAYAKAQGIAPNCPDSPFLTVAWTTLFDTQSGCVRAEEPYSPVSKKRQFALVLGVTSSDPFAARLRFDSVRLDPLP